MNRNQSQGTTDTNAQVDYFDLHVKGCGYLSRVREVPVGRRGSETFLACAISAMHGLCTDPSYSYFDLKVTGAEAEALIRKLWGDVDADRKVFIAFRAGDVWAEPYEVDERNRETRQKTGNKVLRASIKGRLLQITHAKVDGEVVFSSNENTPSDGGTDSKAPASEPAAPEDDKSQVEPSNRPASSQERAGRPQRQTAARVPREHAMQD